MNIKTLLLGSVAAAGMSSAAFAADMPQAMTSLDVCDALGLSGLTISSDTNCVQISGSVEYKFKWGDYESTTIAGYFAAEQGVHNNNSTYNVNIGDGNTNWSSDVITKLNIIATADSDFGPAKAVIKLKNDYTDHLDQNGNSSYNVYIDQAYVSVGDSTVLMAGKKDSIANTGDDTPFNYLGLFNSEAVNTGVYWDNGSGAGTVNPSTSISTGGHVIQVVSDLGNGVSVGAGLEKLDANGTFVGVMNYAGDNLTGHITLVSSNILDNTMTHEWGIHAGATATMDNFKIRGAVAANSNGYWNGLISGEAGFDMFTIAASAEANSEDEWGAGASVTAKLTDTVTLNVGARYYDFNTNISNADLWEVAAAITADVSETLSVTGKVGMLKPGSFQQGVFGYGDVTYGSVGATWTPGGGFTASLTGEANSESAYKVTFDAKKTFE
ncbi:MAG TPA: porin [Devosiaceae bacterium]